MKHYLVIPDCCGCNLSDTEVFETEDEARARAKVLTEQDYRVYVQETGT